MSIYKLALAFEDIPGCGTTYPGWPRPHHGSEGEAQLAERLPSLPEQQLISAAVDAVRLYQLAITVGGELKDGLSQQAGRLYDDYCGSVPLAELIKLLHRGWPLPGPSPRVQDLVAKVMSYALLERIRLPAGEGCCTHWQEQLAGLRHQILGGSGMQLMSKSTGSSGPR